MGSSSCSSSNSSRAFRPFGTGDQPTPSPRLIAIYLREAFLRRRRPGAEALVRRAVFISHGGCASRCSSTSSSLISSSGLESDRSWTKTSHAASRSSTCTAVIDAQPGFARSRRDKATAKSRAQASAGRSCGRRPEPIGRGTRLIKRFGVGLDCFRINSPLVGTEGSSGLVPCAHPCAR